MQQEMPLWTPSDSQIKSSPMYRFMTWCGSRAGRDFCDYDAFHQWSIDDRAGFWSAVWDYCGVRGEKGERLLENGDVMLEARFFPDARLNFAENLLPESGEDDAMVFRGEDKAEDRWSWDRLRNAVSRLQQAFRAMGIEKGDRVAAMVPNMPETVALMLAAASIGAIWSSCSPDFGEQGVLDRFGQIEPTILFIAVEGYFYATARRHDIRRQGRPPSPNSFGVPLKSSSPGACPTPRTIAGPLRHRKRGARTDAEFVAPDGARAGD